MMMNESMDDVDMIPNGGAVTTDNTLTMARNQRVYGPNHVRHARMSAIEVPSPNLQTSLGMVMIKSTQKQQQSINNKSQTTTPTASLVTPTIGVTAFAEGRRAGVGVNGERNKKRSKWQSDEEDEMDSEEDDTYDSSDVESSKVRKRNKVYPPWSVDEDKIILDLQKDLGNNWVEIARQLKGRSRLDVKSRHRSLVRAFNRMWKPEEDKIVLQCHAEFKGDWVEQASKLINRSRNAIRVRFKELTENKILSKAKHIAKQGSPNQLFSQNKSQSSISPMLPTVKEQRINNEGDVISKNNMKTDLIGNRNSSYPQPQSQSTVATTTTSVAPIIGNDPLMTSTNMVSHITIPSYHNTQSQPQQSNPYQMNGHGNNNIKTQQTFNQMSDLSARYSHNNNNNIKSNTYMLFGAPDNTVMNNNTQYDNGNAIMNKINTNVMTNTAPLSTNTNNNNNDSYLLSSPLSDCMLTPLHIPLYFDEDELDTLLQCLV